MLEGPTLGTATNDSKTKYDAEVGGNYVEHPKYGMPFYFKDLRNNQYIIFRANLSGITENVSGDWSEQTYIGRSEKLWTYTGGNRDISFNLKLAAQTPLELNSIYEKLNKLTSLCFPEYAPDVSIPVSLEAAEDGTPIIKGKQRMKPPFLSLRIGELFGNNYFNQAGFIKDVTYTYDDNSPWEFRKGQRVPMIIEAAINYQIIHRQPANMLTQFYGYGDRPPSENLQI